MTQSRSLQRRAFVVGLLLLGAALVFYGLKPKRSEAPPVPPVLVYEWGNDLAVTEPPESAFRESVLSDPVERAVQRFLWGTPDLLYWTQKHLPEDQDRLARRLVQELDRIVEGAPLAARNAVLTLGLLDHESVVPALLRYAKQDPDYLQVVAIQALTHSPWTPEVEDTLAELTTHPNLQVRDAAQRAVLGREGFWDQDTIVEFLTVFEGREVNVLLDEVGEKDLHFAADAVALHLQSPLTLTRQIAIRTLLRLNDPRGDEQAAVEIRSDNPDRVSLGLSIYRDATVAPPPDLAERLAEHPSSDVRLCLAQAIRPECRGFDEHSERYVSILRRLADTTSYSIKRTATKELLRHGSFENLRRYREEIRSGHGDELKEAVQFLCEEVRDSEAAELIRARVQGTVEPSDHANLLFGLRFVGNESDIAHFIQLMHRGGTPEDERGGTQTYLSKHASIYVQTFGAITIPSLIRGYRESRNTYAKLLFLDALRGVADSSEVGEFWLELIRDESLPTLIRVSAAESMPFLEGMPWGTLIPELMETVADTTLVQRLRRVLLCYY